MKKNKNNFSSERYLVLIVRTKRCIKNVILVSYFLIFMPIKQNYLSFLVVERLMNVLEGEDSMSFTPYNVMTNNCEHFASWARNGWVYSHQVVDVAKKVAAVNIFLPLRERLKAFLY